MTLVVACVAGFVGARLGWALLAPSFRRAVFLRRNWRGRAVPTAAGVVVVVVVVVAEAVRAVAAVADLGDQGPPGPARVACLVVVLGLGLLGLLDDLATGEPAGGAADTAADSGDVAGTADGPGRAAAPPEPRGFRGHLGALGRGRLTTGGLKLLGGAAVAVVAAAPFAASLGRLAVDAALVALAANLANLLDRAPGRTTKVGAVAFVLVVAGAPGSPQLVTVALVVGATLGLLADELGERLMLGDAGANVVGGILGLGVVMAVTPPVRLGVMAVLAALNLASEWVSFSRVIEAVGVLRAVDRAGRRVD